MNVIGLTLSRNQYEYVQERCDALPGPRTAEVLLHGWEEFDRKVDRIVSIGAFEHFRRERYDAFFARCWDILPPDGQMMVHSIVQYHRHQLREMGLPVTRDFLEFGKFIAEEIFPGGEVPQPEWVIEHAEKAGFTVEKVQLLLARMLCFPVPTVAAIRGHAFGAGALFSIAHDHSVMRADRGFFCLPGIKLGASYTPGVFALASARLTPRSANEALLTGRRYGGEAALAAGLVGACAGEERVLSDAIEHAAGIAGTRGQVLGEIKQGLYGDAVDALRIPVNGYNR